MIKIIEKEGQFIAISSLDNSINIAKTLEEAYAQAKGDHKNEKLDNTPVNNTNIPDIKQNLKLFFIKLFSTIAILTLFLFFLFGELEKSMEEFSKKFDNIGGSRFWNKIEKEIISSASEDNSISDEKKQEIIKAIKIHVQNLKPFVDEFSPLFSENDN